MSCVYGLYLMNVELENKIKNALQSWGETSNKLIKLSVTLGVIQGIAIVIQAFFIAQTLQQIIILKSADSLVQNLIIIFSLTCFRALVHSVREVVSFNAGKVIRQQVRKGVIEKLNNLGPMYLKTKPEGYWNTVVLEQVEQLQDYYSRYLPQRSLIAFIPLIILVVVFPQSWIAGLILLFTAPLIPLFMILVGKGATKASQQHNYALQRLSSYFADRLSGLSTLKLFYRYQAELKGITQISEDFQSRTMSVLKRAFLSSAVLEFFSAVSIALLAVYLGFSFLEYLDSGFYGVKVTLFSAMFILLLAPEFYQLLRELGSFYHAKAQALAAGEALIELLSHDTSVKPNVDDVDFSSLIIIEAKNLVVVTHENQILLGPIDFCWQQGEKVAIVGKSGSGKTSLLNAILGFLPYQGSLKVNGVELRNISTDNWYQQLGWLGQLPKLLNTSLRDNLLMAAPNATDEALKKALQQVELPQFQTKLDKTIGDKNAGLSVGQSQRVALARMLLKPKKILLLDEPTAALDTQTQNSLWHQLHEQLQATGGFVVTHKRNEMKSLDTIWIMENGKITHQDRYEVLAPLLMQYSDEGEHHET